MDKKFIKSKKLDDYEVLTPDGWIDINAIHETIKYDIYVLKTKTYELKCADNHIVILKNNEQIFVKDLKIGDEIITISSPEKVLSIEKTNSTENMYDLELDYDSKKVYYTNGILSHNTMYLRYLTSKLKKHIIFLPPEMVNSITDPSFIPFLMNNNNSILVIEDAEPALEKRSTGSRNSAISNVLNMTDGLLSDCLNISIIATFNVDTKNIDEALLRKGRLLTQYKFEKLSVEKSKTLLKKLGHGEIEVKEPMTLADIYYYSENNNGCETRDTKKKIGFKI